MPGPISVSYTHLDVYKRQTLYPGDELEIKIMLQLEDGSYPDINCMVGGDRKILENGEVLETDWAELHPRTAIGYSADRSKVYMLVVDGRQGGYRCV